MKKRRLSKHIGDILLLLGIIAVISGLKGWPLIAIISAGIIMSVTGAYLSRNDT